MIDLEHLDRQTAGDRALQDELLHLFVEQMEDLRRLLSPDHDTPVSHLALRLHRCRGAAAGMGARALCEALEVAERDLTGGTRADPLLARLEAPLDATVQYAHGLIDARRPGGLAKADESQ